MDPVQVGILCAIGAGLLVLGSYLRVRWLNRSKRDRLELYKQLRDEDLR
jgi:hypothetical protein